MADYPRQISESEAAVLAFLLPKELPDSESLRAQLEDAVVVWRCPCGCIEFDVALSIPPTVDAMGWTVTALSEIQQIHLTLDLSGPGTMGVRVMWFGDENARIDPDLSTFEIEARPLY